MRIMRHFPRNTFDTEAKNATDLAARRRVACAEDTKGQTCFICTQALHWKTKEGLVRGCACRGTAGFAHVSCLAEQAKILLAEAEENNLGEKVVNARWMRWSECSLCEQKYHGVVRCALGWACWKTYVDRPETDKLRQVAMNQLGLGLSSAEHHADALSVNEAQLSMGRRLGYAEYNMLAMQSNLALTYEVLGRLDEGLRLRQDVYSRTLKLLGKEHSDTLLEANNYAGFLITLERCEEAKSLLLKVMPVARRVLGENNEVTLRLRWTYAKALYKDPDATLDDLREVVATLEDTLRTARRVLGGAHPAARAIERCLEESRAALRAREAPLPGSA
ncbi:unnamed protein product [Pelagomonas calceolata]|uniref:RING-CH-type domain-containing protein n=1 Tax=Pelagomonas calceolata TaxID=35677 RepID=A0A8J2SMI8_9STRA|nr:unnamed protein product [Pelagomonas calceolata]